MVPLFSHALPWRPARIERTLMRPSECWWTTESDQKNETRGCLPPSARGSSRACTRVAASLSEGALTDQSVAARSLVPVRVRGFFGFRDAASQQMGQVMPRDQRCTLTAQLAPHSSTAALLRLISILHSRGTEVLDLNYESREDGATVTATVSLGNVGHLPLRHSLLRSVEVLDVVADLDPEAVAADRRAVS